MVFNREVSEIEMEFSNATAPFVKINDSSEENIEDGY